MKYSEQYNQMLDMIHRKEILAEDKTPKGDDVYLYGPILSEETRLFYEMFFGSDAGSISAIKFASLIKDRSGALTIRINSPGGVVSEGASIASLIESYDGEVTAIVDGACYSAAVDVLLAADIRKISKLGEVMVHRPFMGMIGNSEDFAKASKDLLGVEDTMLEYFSERTGQDKDIMRKLVNEETFLQPKQAREHGFINDSPRSTRNKQTLVKNEGWVNVERKASILKAEERMNVINAELRLRNLLSR